MNWHYILGALYLFVINSIFIALATFATVKYLHYPVVESATDKHGQMTRTTAAVVLVAIIVPSVFSAEELDAGTVDRIKNWLKVRLEADSVDVVVSVRP